MVWVKYGVLSIFALAAQSLMAQGTIRGTVRSDSGTVPGILVTLSGSGDTTYERLVQTDGSGNFRFNDVPAGTYSAQFSATGYETHVEENIQVSDGATVTLNISMVSPTNVMEVLTVAAASRRPERIVEAPAAVTVLTANEIERQSAHGQLPRLLESTPGVELAQSDIFDFNINARGFNSSLNRRILVLIDGRDPATGFLGNQEWSALSFPLDEIATMELVRGPGSALYGADAFNGVLNITTKRPYEDLGGKVAVSGGNLSSQRIDLKYAGEIGSGWSYRVNGGTFTSDTWSRSRTVNEQGRDIEGNLVPGLFEYPGLGAAELIPLGDDEVESTYFGGRLDRDFNGGEVLTLEFGTATVDNGLAVTGIGRVKVLEAERPWFRANFNAPHYNISYSNTRRTADKGQQSLGTGNLLYEDSEIQHLEFQFNYDFFEDRVQLVAGAAYNEEDIDTRDPQGNHTLMKEAKNEDQQSAFGQVKFKLNENIDLILAGRWDDSSLHDSQESPKAAIVWKINRDHSIRGTWNEAFQVANYSEYFLRAASANIIPFGLIQDGVVLGGFGLNLRNVGQDGQPLGPNNGPPLLDWRNIPLVAAGNPNLVPEEIESWEVGYKGVISSRLYLTLDYYQSEIVNFITDLLPGVNGNFAPFQIQENIPAEIANALLGTIRGALGPAISSGLTNQTIDTNPSGLSVTPDGHPVVVVSYTNAGQVDTEGIDLAFNFYINDTWVLDGNYSWFDFDVIDQLVGDQLIPNASENKYNLGLTYNGSAITANLNLHSVEGFPWAAGIYVGEIPSYETVNLSFQYKLGDRWTFSFTGNNLADDEHYEIFGGSVNGRRVLGTVKLNF